MGAINPGNILLSIRMMKQNVAVKDIFVNKPRLPLTAFT